MYAHIYTYLYIHICTPLINIYYTYRGSPGGPDGKEFTFNAGDPGSFLGSGRFPGGWNHYSFQYSCLESPMDKVAWHTAVHRVAKNQT